MIPRSPTRWEREQKATLLALLILAGLCSLVAYCTSPFRSDVASDAEAVHAQSTTPSAAPPNEEGLTP